MSSDDLTAAYRRGPDLAALAPASAAGMGAIGGDPVTLVTLATELTTLGETLRETAVALTRLRRSARWEGPGGEAFTARAGEVPAGLQAAAGRYLACGAAVRQYAAELSAALAVTTAEGAAHTDHYAAAVRWQDATARAEGSSDSAEQAAAATYRARATVEMLACHDAHTRWRSAREAWAEADRRCGRVLRAANDDALQDSHLYRGLAGSVSVLDGISTAAAAFTVVPVLAPASEGVSDGAAVLALGVSTGLALGYGDVDDRELAERVVLAAGPALVGKVLRGAAVMRTVDGRALTAVERVRFSAAAMARRAPSDVVVPPTAAALRIPRGLPLRDRMVLKRLDQVNRRYLADLRIVVRHGPVETGMLVASWVARDARAANAKVEKVQDRVAAVRSRFEPDSRRAPDQRVVRDGPLVPGAAPGEPTR